MDGANGLFCETIIPNGVTDCYWGDEKLRYRWPEKFSSPFSELSRGEIGHASGQDFPGEVYTHCQSPICMEGHSVLALFVN